MDALAVPTLPFALDEGRLEALRKNPGTGTARAAHELEAVFLTQLLQAMRKTIPQNDLLPRSPERDVYDGAFDRSVAETLAAGDPLGLVRALGAEGLKSGPGPADISSGHPGSKGGTT
jgi:Rod binding domain-containing protein